MRLPISLTLVSLAALASPALAQKDAPDAQKQHAEKVAEAVAANWASAPVEEVTQSGKGTARVDGKSIAYTQTAGTLTIRDEQLAAMAEATHAGWPVQWRYGYALRLARSQLLKGLAYRPPFAAFRTGCRLLGLDYDHLLNSSARGFSGKQLIPQIQQSPSAPLTRLVARRIRTFHDTHLARRTILGHRLLAAIGQHAQFLGHRGHNHTFWVFPVLARDPIRLIARLRKAGFDATQGESMQIVASPTDRSDSAATIRRSFPRIVYIPLYPDMPESDIDRMGKTVCEVESETS